MDFGLWHILVLILASLLISKSMSILRSLELLGLFFLVLYIYGGVTLMTAKTAEELKKENPRAIVVAGKVNRIFYEECAGIRR